MCSRPSALRWRWDQNPPTLLASTSSRGYAERTSPANRRTSTWDDRSVTKTSTVGLPDSLAIAVAASSARAWSRPVMPPEQHQARERFGQGRGWCDSPVPDLRHPITRFVVDASVVLHVAAEGIEVPREHELLAPSLLRSQTLPFLHEAVQAGEIPADVGLVRLTRIGRMKIRLLGDTVLRRRAWDLADQLGMGIDLQTPITSHLPSCRRTRS